MAWFGSIAAGLVGRSRLRRLGYGLLALVTAIAVWGASPQVVQARDWLDLIFRGVQVLQLSNLSDRDEVQLGRQIDQQLTRQTRIITDPRINSYVSAIGDRLVQASSRPNIPYTFRVIADRGVNAYATMGGFVYVNAGLMLAADNEAQLASVIGHEIGHVAARHAVGQMRQRAIAAGVLSATGLDRNRAVQIGVDLAVNRPNSRSDELEADRLSLEMLARSGYGQIGAIQFFEKLLGQPSPPNILSTHPNTRDRIAIARQLIQPRYADGAGLDNRAYQAILQSLFR